jgi:hypothetical protein
MQIRTDFPTFYFKKSFMTAVLLRACRGRDKNIERSGWRANMTISQQKNLEDLRDLMNRF